MVKRHTTFHKPEPVKNRKITKRDLFNIIDIGTGGKAGLIESAFRAGSRMGSGGGGGGGATLTTGSKIKKPKKK